MYPRRVVISASALTLALLLFKPELDPLDEAIAKLPHRQTMGRPSAMSLHRPYQPGVTSASFSLRSHLKERTFSSRLEELHTRGVTRLAMGDVAGAVDSLRGAATLVEMQSAGPQRIAVVLNDYATALCESSRRNPTQLIVGLDVIQKAWALDPTPATAWTRAVLLTAVASSETAAAAWDDYLALDSHSAWAEEARLRRPRRIRDASESMSIEVIRDTGFAAIERYDALIARFTAEGHRNAAASALLLRAETLDAMGAEAEAWSDRLQAKMLASGRTSERAIDSIAMAATRDGYHHAAQALFHRDKIALASLTRWRRTNDDEVIGIAARNALADERTRESLQNEGRVAAANGDVASALWLSDRARRVGRPARELSPCGAALAGRNLDALGRQLANCVPNGVTLVHQDLHKDELQTWIIGNGTIHFRSTRISAPRLIAEIEQFRADLQRGETSASVRLQARGLYDVLLRPVAREIDGGGLLVLSASPNLRDVPLAALHDGEAFLLQRRLLATTTTISSFELPRATPNAAAAYVVLPPVSPGRAPLRGAEHEVRTVAGMYGRQAALVTGAAATPSQFLTGASAYDVIHVATHGRASAVPYQNAIEFGARRVRAFDIVQLELARRPVVMLATCSSADQSEAPANVSLSSAFLAAGASCVVGSLWDVQDDETAQLSVAFHRNLARGLAPHAALRNAQLQAIRNGMSPSTWAAFQLTS